MRTIARLFFRKAYFLKARLRHIYWRFILEEMHPTVRVYGKIIVGYPGNIKVGAHSTLNDGVILNGRAPLIIGSHVHVSPFCALNTAGLDISKTMGDRTHVVAPIVLEDGVWLGTNVLVSPGVRIGRNSVIGAGAVVTKDIPPNVLAAGVPAKTIRELTLDTEASQAD